MRHWVHLVRFILFYFFLEAQVRRRKIEIVPFSFVIRFFLSALQHLIFFKIYLFIYFCLRLAGSFLPPRRIQFLIARTEIDSSGSNTTIDNAIVGSYRNPSRPFSKNNKKMASLKEHTSCCCCCFYKP